MADALPAENMSPQLLKVAERAQRQKKRLNWESFLDLYRDFPLPRPRVVVQLWAVRKT